MKKNVLFAAAMSLFVFMATGSAQDKVTNFGGAWTLDVARSKLDERTRIESQTLTVTQNDKELKVETATTRKAMPEGYQGGPGGGMARGGAGADVPFVYSLDGKETKTEQQGPMGNVPVVLKAKFDAGKLTLTRTSTFNGPMGEMTMTTKETWELSADGKTLTVNAERSSPRGSESTTRVFSRRS